MQTTWSLLKIIHVDLLGRVLDLLSFHGLCWPFQPSRYLGGFFFAKGISAIIPLGESGIEHVVDPENQDAQGDGGCLGVHFRTKDT